MHIHIDGYHHHHHSLLRTRQQKQKKYTMQTENTGKYILKSRTKPTIDEL